MMLPSGVVWREENEDQRCRRQAADKGSCFEETLMTKAFSSNMELITAMSVPGRQQRVVTTPPGRTLAVVGFG